jgi:hypothetical protein
MVTSVELEPPDEEFLVAHHLDFPQVGECEMARSLDISGWVVGRGGPVERLVIKDRHRTLMTSPVRGERLDVADVHKGLSWAATSGYRSMIGLVGVAPEYELQLYVEGGVTASKQVKIATIRGHRPRVQPSHSPRLDPVLVTSSGRMGTTWLLSLLGKHPALVVHDRYPHEMSAGRYWLHMLRVLGAPSPLGSFDGRFSDDMFQVGRDPMFSSYIEGERNLLRWLDQTYVDRLASFCVGAIDDFYATVRPDAHDASHFVEKGLADGLSILARELYQGFHEIFLVRDIRDTICSIYAVNEKRGRLSFGRERFSDDREHVQSVGRTYRRLLESWRASDGSALLVHYEDLVTDPAGTLASILDNLGIDSSPATVRRMLSDEAARRGVHMQGHGTAATPAESVGRWRRDLPEALRPAVLEHCGRELEAFGYSLD